MFANHEILNLLIIIAKTTITKKKQLKKLFNFKENKKKNLKKEIIMK